MEIYIELQREELQNRLSAVGLWQFNAQHLATAVERMLSALYPEAERVEVLWSRCELWSLDEINVPEHWDRDVREDVEQVIELLLRAWAGEPLAFGGEVVEEVILEEEAPSGTLREREAWY